MNSEDLAVESPPFPARELTQWYDLHHRDLPWRRTQDPYAIWISEVMLQQTRVDTVVPYYERWMRAFPTIQALAQADRQEVLKVWEGLGYYSRARNAHDAANMVLSEYNGIFPTSAAEVRKLKGIGPYTTAAICSIAFGQDLAVVDGNVIRVLSRFFHIDEDIRKPAVVKEIQQLADIILPKGDAGRFNQAVMELGATICKPRNPECLKCPLSANCIAFKEMAVDRLPYKSPAKKIPHHVIVVCIIMDDQERLLIAQRPEEAMLGGLWEFPGGKVEKDELPEDGLRREIREELGVDLGELDYFHSLDHGYSHFKITLMAWLGRIKEGTPAPRASQQLKWVRVADLSDYPFPKANRVLTQKLQKQFG